MLCALLVSLATNQDPFLPPPPMDKAVIEDWRGMRFGMFIHWGPVSIKGTEIGWSRGKQVPREEYDQLYKQFNPVEFDADEWVDTAQRAGMKYVILTAKHHDGFALWDSEFTDYDIMATPFKRDVVKELADACRKKGLKFGVYYSILDWYHPDYNSEGVQGGPGYELEDEANMDRYEKFVHDQVSELVENYGPFHTIWFDGEWEKPWTEERGDRLFKLCRKLDARMLINNRVGKARDGMAGTSKQSANNIGDYDTPEQQVGSFNMNRPWETCMTIATQWAWKPNDKLKSLDECVRILTNTVGGDGNLLLNVGPMPDGRIEPRQAERLLEIGKWMSSNNKSIYRTRGGPFYPGRWGTSTRTIDAAFIHFNAWDGDSIVLPPYREKINFAWTLGGVRVKWVQTDKAIVLTLPEDQQLEFDKTIELRFINTPNRMAQIKEAVSKFDLGAFGEWVSNDATYTMSSRDEDLSKSEKELLTGDKYDADFAFHTKNETRPFIDIKLRKGFRIRGVEILSRQLKSSENLAIWASFDGRDWTKLWNADVSKDRWEVDLRSGRAQYQFVRIGLDSETPAALHLNSVRIFGD